MRPAARPAWLSRRHRLALALAFAAPAAATGCLQKLDSSASSQAQTAGDGALVTRIVPTGDPIALDLGDETKTTADPCTKTRQDKTEILSAYCAGCHSGSAAVGLPPWDFVMIDQRLVTETWTREGQPAQRFVIPGDPDHSALYARMAVIQDMPPRPTDLIGPVVPRPSAAESSIIREWILHCIAGASMTGGGGHPGADGGGAVGGTGGADARGGGTGNANGGYGTVGGGASGGGGGSRYGGTTGSGGDKSSDGGASSRGGSSGGGSGGVSGGDGVGGGSGGGGSGGARNTDGGTSDGGLRSCGTGVSSGGSCTKGTASCTLHTHTCECHLVDGKHKWVCQ